MNAHPELRMPPGGPTWPTAAALDSMLAAEELRSLGRYGGARPDLVTVRWDGPVVLTAPHAVAHWREGRRKPADMATGFLVDAVAHQSGSTTVVAEGEQSRDGSFHTDSAFRRRVDLLLPHARAVLDVHGMTDAHGVDVCLGRGRDHALSDPLVEVVGPALERAGFTVSVDVPYDAAQTDTLTRHAHAAGVPALQIEVARRLRMPVEETEACLWLIETLTGAVQAVAAAP